MEKAKVRKPQKVLCYIDLSKPSHYVVEYAHMIAERMDAELYVLHAVTDIRKFAGFYVPHINTDKLEQEMPKAAQDKMYAICSQSIGDLDHDHRLVRIGDPLEVLNKEIAAKDIDLLVLGHEIGSLSMFKSDYAQKFLKDPKCPAVVLPITGE